MKIGPFSSHPVDNVGQAAPQRTPLRAPVLVLKGCNETALRLPAPAPPSQRSPVRCQRDGPPPLRGRVWRPRTPPIRRLPTGSSAFSALCCRMAIRSPSDIEASAAVRTVSSDVSSNRDEIAEVKITLTGSLQPSLRAPWRRRTSAAIETASISVPRLPHLPSEFVERFDRISDAFTGEVAETHLHAGEGSFDVYAPLLKLTEDRY